MHDQETNLHLDDTDRFTLARELLRHGRAELVQLRRVRGAYRRTARKIARATAMVAFAASLLGIPLAGTSAAVTPSFGPPQVGAFGLTSIGEIAVPSFGDVDGDGDLDAFIGGSGELNFFENTGGPPTPSFTAGGTNPFGVTPGTLGPSPFNCPVTAAAFVDIDGDGLLDAFVGQKYGVDYFRHDPPNPPNDPTFTHLTSLFTDPPSGVLTDPIDCYEPSLADIDGDGDLDAFAGVIDCGADPSCPSPAGVTLFWENTGNAAMPAFVQQTPSWLSGLHDYGRAPSFGDIDGDGDLDAFIGDVDGNINFVENVGNASAPSFDPPEANPFGLEDVGSASAATLADIDADGDLDLLVGTSTGDTVFFENITGAPLCTDLPPDPPTPPDDEKAAQKCTRAIGKEASKFAAAQTKALQKCEDAKLRGVHTDPCPSSSALDGTPAKKADDLIEKAKTKLGQQIAKACGGADKTCGTGSDGEELASALGFAFSGATCPDFENSGECDIPIANCDDIADCVECITDEAVQDALTADYEGLVPAPSGSDMQKCQRAIGKEATKFQLLKDKVIQKCWDKALSGQDIGSTTCPDINGAVGLPASKAAVKIWQAEEKKVAAICKACGGDDQLCDGDIDTGLIAPGGGTVGSGGGSDDLLPTTGLTDCPDVVLPDAPGTDCGTLDDLDNAPDTIDSLREVILCADCVTAHQVDCLDAAARPQSQPFPCECTIAR